MTETRRSGWLVVLAVVCVLGALVAIAAAWATDVVACDSGPSDFCSRQGLVRAQLGVAVAGLLPAGLFAYAAWRGLVRSAVVWFAVGALFYLAWGVLNDAAVHGWDDLRVF